MTKNLPNMDIYKELIMIITLESLEITILKFIIILNLNILF